MKVLSLDFDGVLHPAVQRLEPPSLFMSGLDAGAPALAEDPATHFQWIPVLAQILLPWPEVKLAVHSTWRYDHSTDQLVALLGPLGTRVVAVAPNGPREESILGMMYRLKVNDYRVLDDARHEFRDSVVQRLIVCNSRLGVTDPTARLQLQAWLEEAAR